MPADHLGGEAWELAWSRDVPRTDAPLARTWLGRDIPVPVDEPDVAGRVLLADAVSRYVHSTASRVGRGICVWHVRVQVHDPKTLVGGPVSGQDEHVAGIVVDT